MGLTPEDIREIIRVFAGSDLEELDVEIEGTRLRLSKNAGAPAQPATRTVAAVTGSAEASPAAPVAAPGPHGASGPQAPSPSGPPSGSGVPLPSGVVSPAADGTVELRSPLLGVFYRRPSPDQPPFVEVDSEVDAGDDVCIIDVMKMFTRVQAGTAGTIVEIAAEDGQLVEYGQVIMRIKPR